MSTGHGQVTPEAVTQARAAFERVIAEGNRSQGHERGPNYFLLGDGTDISVIAGWGTYCTPRPDWPLDWGGAPEDYPGPYSTVEVWFSGEDDPEGHVEVDRLRAYIDDHGGIVDCQAEYGAVPPWKNSWDD